MVNPMHSGNDTPEQAVPSPAGRAEGLFFGLALVYFGVKAMYFALRIRDHIFPDESSWFGMAELFSRSAWLPVDSPESYHLGLVTHIPTLYFFLMGKLLLFNVLPVDDLIFLRLVNVLLALVTVTYAWRLARLLGVPLAVRCLFMVMVTNTVMFTFVSGSVNNDNLSTLLAVLSLYYLLRFFQGRSTWHGLLFALFLLAGPLSKSVFVPYAAALVLVLLFHEHRRLLELPRAVAARFSTLGWRETILVVLCLAGLAANLQLYGGNKLRHGALLPSMDRVLPVAACLNNRLFARDYVVREYQAGKLTMLEAQRVALRIRDPGDRASALSRLAEAASSKAKGGEARMSRLRYAREWVEVMVARTYSVAAHLSLFKYDRDFYPYYALFALAGLLWLCRLRTLLIPGLGGVGFVALFYTLFLMQVVGYVIYRGSGFTGVATTGRYLFPALVALYLVTAHGLLARMPRWWQAGAGVAVGLWFIAGEFPWFLRHAGPEWYF